MIISLIVAASENNVIGTGNTLPWHLPDDFKRMKDLTLGKPIIMGRKTHESIGRALPGRLNIVITRQKELKFLGCEKVSSLQEALKRAAHERSEEVFIFGGGEIFKEALPMAERVYMTRVHAHVDGDAFFPELLPSEWKMTWFEKHPADDKHQYAFTFQNFERIQ
jgi:dihydrofolate reductase